MEPPRSSKITRNLKKCPCLSIKFLRVIAVFTSKNDPKSINLLIFRFCENRAPVEARAQYSRFGVSKNHPKKALEKRRAESHPKSQFLAHFGSQNPSKNHSKIVSKKRRYAPQRTRWLLNAPHPRHQAQKDSYKSSIYLYI